LATIAGATNLDETQVIVRQRRLSDVDAVAISL
jgi:hypothetical protein